MVTQTQSGKLVRGLLDSYTKAHCICWANTDEDPTPPYLIPGVWFWRCSCQRCWWWCWRQRGDCEWGGCAWWWEYVQAERQQGQDEAAPGCGMELGPGPVPWFWKSGHSCCPQGQQRVEWKWQCWQQSGGGWTGGDEEDREWVEGRWCLAGLCESLMAGEEEAVEDGGRFLREPFCLTKPPFRLWFDLLVFWTTCDLCCFCWAIQAVSFPMASSSPSGVGQSPLEASARGSWPLLTGVLALEGALPLTLRGRCPPLLSIRGSPLASLRAIVLSQQAWQGQCHSSMGQKRQQTEWEGCSSSI